MTVKRINHPSEYYSGVRLIVRCTRLKDGVASRSNIRPDKNYASYDEDSFMECLTRLEEDLRPHERIYFSTDERDTVSAQRIFMLEQTNVIMSNSQENKDNFFKSVGTKWKSALGKSPKTKKFLFDLDKELSGSWREIIGDIRAVSQNAYMYNTKNGIHVITAPFNPNLLILSETKSCRKTNSMMLSSFCLQDDKGLRHG